MKLFSKVLLYVTLGVGFSSLGFSNTRGLVVANPKVSKAIEEARALLLSDPDSVIEENRKILALYGSEMSEEQKTELKALKVAAMVEESLPGFVQRLNDEKDSVSLLALKADFEEAGRYLDIDLIPEEQKTKWLAFKGDLEKSLASEASKKDEARSSFSVMDIIKKRPIFFAGLVIVGGILIHRWFLPWYRWPGPVVFPGPRWMVAVDMQGHSFFSLVEDKVIVVGQDQNVAALPQAGEQNAVGVGQ